MEKETNLIVGRHYPAIDGLRGIAVLLVVWFHSSYFITVKLSDDLLGFSRIYYILSIIGESGVDLFFVISGFLITGILIDTHGHKHCFRNFYIRRVLRIFPLYYSVLFIFLTWFFLCSGGEDALSGAVDYKKVMTYLFYLQNWLPQENTDQFILLSHTWSLAVEEQFYLVWPLIFFSYYKKTSMRQLATICVSMIGISWGLHVFFGANGAYRASYMMTICRADELALGALLSILCRHKIEFLQRVRPIFPYCIGVSFLMVIGLMFWGIWSQGGQLYGARDISVVYGLMFFAIAYVSFLAYVFLSPDTNILKRTLSVKPLRVIGKVSYGFYLFHFPVMIVMARWLDRHIEIDYWSGHLFLLLGGGLVSFILAYASYNLFEKRILRLKDKLAPLDGS